MYTSTYFEVLRGGLVGEAYDTAVVDINRVRLAVSSQVRIAVAPL